MTDVRSSPTRIGMEDAFVQLKDRLIIKSMLGDNHPTLLFSESRQQLATLCDNPRRKPLQALRATRAAVNTSPYRQSSRPRSENKNGSLRSRFYYYRESARKGWRVDPGHVFHHAHDLAAVA